MVRSVPSALLSTGHACADARLDQTVEGEEIRLRRLRENPGRGVTDIGADVIEGDAGSEVGDIGLDEIGICALRAGLHAGEAGVNRRGEVAGTDQERRGGGLQHFAGIGHAHRQPRGRRGTTRSGAETICACDRPSDGGGERAIQGHRVVGPDARRSATPAAWPDDGPPARRGRRRRWVGASDGVRTVICASSKAAPSPRSWREPESVVADVSTGWKAARQLPHGMAVGGVRGAASRGPQGFAARGSTRGTPDAIAAP